MSTRRTEAAAEAPTDVGPNLAAMLAEDTPVGKRSDRFHGMVRICGWDHHYTRAQTAALLEPWCERVGKFVARVERQVDASWDAWVRRIGPPDVEPPLPDVDPPEGTTGHLLDDQPAVTDPHDSPATAETPVPPPTEPSRPVLAQEAYHGLIGEIVSTLAPYTEAHPAALLGSCLAWAGCLIGREPHALVGAEQHPPRVWPLLVGSTSNGRKGTANTAIRQLFALAYPDFYGDGCDHVNSGLSTGEGLIEAVCDASTGKDAPPEVTDKRLLVVETEFAAVLIRSRKEGNTLGPVLHQAYDDGNLHTIARRKNRLRATGAHIVVCGHVSPGELKLALSQADLVGGTINRFLPLLVHRAQWLPDGGSPPDDVLNDLARRLKQRTSDIGRIGRMFRTDEASKLWRDEVYPELCPNEEVEGLLGHVVARAAPQTLRLSVLYALLDPNRPEGSAPIDVAHVQAARALWRYSYASTEQLFGSASGNRDLDRLKAFVDRAGTAGVTRTQVYADLFTRNRSAEQVTQLLDALLEDGHYEVDTRWSGSKSTTIYRRKPQRDL